jgi:large subunit ribosomal protein L13
MKDLLVINAEGCAVGRLASFAAKQALLGKKVIIVNAEKAIISGKKQNILDKYLSRIKKGRGWQKGPYWPRQADKLLRRIIRGMLPWKKTRGRDAYKRIKCIKGIPKEYEDKATEIKDLKRDFLHFITLEQLEKLLKPK